MNQTGRALDPFVPLLEKTSVCNVFIVQVLEKAILGWWKSLTTTEQVEMQQHMFTITDFFLRVLGILDKNHSVTQTLHSPTSN